MAHLPGPPFPLSHRPKEERPPPGSPAAWKWARKSSPKHLPKYLSKDSTVGTGEHVDFGGRQASVTFSLCVLGHQSEPPFCSLWNGCDDSAYHTEISEISWKKKAKHGMCLAQCPARKSKGPENQSFCYYCSWCCCCCYFEEVLCLQRRQLRDRSPFVSWRSFTLRSKNQPPFTDTPSQAQVTKENKSISWTLSFVLPMIQSRQWKDNWQNRVEFVNHNIWQGTCFQNIYATLTTLVDN